MSKYNINRNSFTKNLKENNTKRKYNQLNNDRKQNLKTKINKCNNINNNTIDIPNKIQKKIITNHNKLVNAINNSNQDYDILIKKYDNLIISCNESINTINKIKKNYKLYELKNNLKELPPLGFEFRNMTNEILNFKNNNNNKDLIIFDITKFIMGYNDRKNWYSYLNTIDKLDKNSIKRAPDILKYWQITFHINETLKKDKINLSFLFDNFSINKLTNNFNINKNKLKNNNITSNELNNIHFKSNNQELYLEGGSKPGFGPGGKPGFGPGGKPGFGPGGKPGFGPGGKPGFGPGSKPGFGPGGKPGFGPGGKPGFGPGGKQYTGKISLTNIDKNNKIQDLLEKKVLRENNKYMNPFTNESEQILSLKIIKNNDLETNKNKYYSLVNKILNKFIKLHKYYLYILCSNKKKLNNNSVTKKNLKNKSIDNQQFRGNKPQFRGNKPQFRGNNPQSRGNKPQSFRGNNFEFKNNQLF